jgi:hypothetical protein
MVVIAPGGLRCIFASCVGSIRVEQPHHHVVELDIPIQNVNQEDEVFESQKDSSVMKMALPRLSEEKGRRGFGFPYRLCCT